MNISDLMKYVSVVVIFFVCCSIVPAFGEDMSEDYFEYVLRLDDHVISIPYNVNANVISMNIDPNSASLLIGIAHTQNSIFRIVLQKDVISAPNNEFVILVDGYETDYNVITEDVNSSTILFYVPELSEEVEIIGTHVIPEFPLGIFSLLVFFIMMGIIFTRIKPIRLMS